MSEEEGQMIAEVQAIAAGIQWGKEGAETRIAWCIDGPGVELPQVRKKALWVVEETDGIKCWMDNSERWIDERFIFDTELAARNELEQRLCARSENLRKHRQDMSRLLVACAEKTHPIKRRERE